MLYCLQQARVNFNDKESFSHSQILFFLFWYAVRSATKIPYNCCDFFFDGGWFRVIANCGFVAKMWAWSSRQLMFFLFVCLSDLMCYVYFYVQVSKKFKISDRLWIYLSKVQHFLMDPKRIYYLHRLIFFSTKLFLFSSCKVDFFFQSTRFLMDPELSTSNLGCIMTKLNFSVFFILSCQSSTNKSSGCYRRRTNRSFMFKS